MGVVPHQEPGIDADAVPADARTGLEDVHARVHIADADNLIDVHVVVAADAGEFVGKSDVDGAEGVLDDLGHLGGADVSNDNFALAEGGVVLLDLLSYLAAVGADRAVVVEEFINHVAGDDALGGVDQVEILPYLESAGFDDGTDVFVDGAGADGALDDDRRAFGANFHHVLDGGYDVAGVDFLGEFVVRRGDGDDVGVRLLVFGSELDAFGEGGGE